MKGKSIYFSVNTMIGLPKLKNVTYVTHIQTDMEIKGGILLLKCLPDLIDSRMFILTFIAFLN